MRSTSASLLALLVMKVNIRMWAHAVRPYRSSLYPLSRGARADGVKVSAFQPIPLPLGQMGQGLERRDAVSVHLALQVIVFMLDHPGMKVFGDEIHRLAVTVQRL